MLRAGRWWTRPPGSLSLPMQDNKVVFYSMKDIFGHNYRSAGHFTVILPVSEASVVLQALGCKCCQVLSYSDEYVILFL